MASLHSDRRQRKPATARQWLLTGLAWVLTSAMGVWTLLVTRSAWLNLYVALRLPTEAYGLADKWSFVLLAIFCLVAILVIESYYEHAGGERPLARRFARTSLVELAVLSVAYLVRWLAGR
jgi:hypothetical protein